MSLYSFLSNVAGRVRSTISSYADTTESEVTTPFRDRKPHNLSLSIPMRGLGTFISRELAAKDAYFTPTPEEEGVDLFV